MKKLLALFMAMLLGLTVIGATSTVFAEEVEYLPVDDEFIQKYWRSWDSDEVVKVGDWYYKIYIDYNGKKILRGVCGYDGNETEITIPNELGGTPITQIVRFRLISNTVKTIKIPKEIRGFDRHYNLEDYITCEEFTKLEEIIVEEGSGDFWSENGVLYEGYSLCYYPPAKKDVEYIIPKDIDTIEVGAIKTQNHLKSLTITQDVSLIHEDSITPTLENLYFYTVQDVATNNADYYSGDIYYGVHYMPKALNGTIYCIEGSEAEIFYSKHSQYYKNLEVLRDELIKKEDGKWYFYRGGVIDVNALGNNGYVSKKLVKYSGKWFYLEDGIWTKKDTLCEYNGKWFYIDNGKWNKNANDLIKYKEKWFYVENGKWDSTDRTLFKKNGKWFGIVNGKWDSSTKTLIKYKDKWFYIKNGKWCQDTAIVKYKGKRFYVKNGKVDFDYSGKKKIDGKTYKIKNGKVA